MKLLVALLALGLGGCLIIEEDYDDARYYRPGSRQYGYRPYVEAQQYYGVQPRYYRRRSYVTPAEVYEDRRYLNRRYYRGDDD